MILCKWFDAGISSLKISFTSDFSVVEMGVEILVACVATNIQYSKRLNWRQRNRISSGDCENGELSEIMHCTD